MTAFPPGFGLLSGAWSRRGRLPATISTAGMGGNGPSCRAHWQFGRGESTLSTACGFRDRADTRHGVCTASANGSMPSESAWANSSTTARALAWARTEVSPSAGTAPVRRTKICRSDKAARRTGRALRSPVRAAYRLRTSFRAPRAARNSVRTGSGHSATRNQCNVQ
jgi:hypothetical protein